MVIMIRSRRVSSGSRSVWVVVTRLSCSDRAEVFHNRTVLAENTLVPLRRPRLTAESGGQWRDAVVILICAVTLMLIGAINPWVMG
jgi:hypothetical protein